MDVQKYKHCIGVISFLSNIKEIKDFKNHISKILKRKPAIYFYGPEDTKIQVRLDLHNKCRNSTSY